MRHFHETTTTITATTTMITTTTTTVVLFIVSQLLRIARSDDDPPTSPSSTTPGASFNETASVSPVTADEGNYSTVAPLDEDGGAAGGHVFDTGTLLRTLYVFVGVTLIVAVYFVVRSLLLRCRKNRRTKYGLLATNDDTVEMRHLEEEEEEDAMVFDRTQSNSHRR